MENENEIQHLTPEQQRAVAALVPAAMDYCNVSPINAELVGTDFHAALARGEATLTVEVVLPRGGVRIVADWPAAEIDRREIAAFVPPPVFRA
jgi:hypothetical protein